MITDSVPSTIFNDLGNWAVVKTSSRLTGPRGRNYPKNHKCWRNWPWKSVCKCWSSTKAFHQHALARFRMSLNGCVVSHRNSRQSTEKSTVELNYCSRKTADPSTAIKREHPWRIISLINVAAASFIHEARSLECPLCLGILRILNWGMPFVLLWASRVEGGPHMKELNATTS